MAATLTVSLALGRSQTGLTLSAQLVDDAGAAVGSAVPTGFVELGAGNYLWTYNAFPDGFRGGVAFSAGATLQAVVALNPPDFPGGAGLTGADVQAALTSQGYTPARAVRLDNADVATSTRLATAGYTAPPTDYQQRTVAVLLPTTPPAGYGGATAAAVVSALTTTTVIFRDLTAVTAPTIMDAYAAGIVAAAGAETVAGMAYTRKTPTGGTFRAFTLTVAPGDQARS